MRAATMSATTRAAAATTTASAARPSAARNVLSAAAGQRRRSALVARASVAAQASSLDVTKMAPLGDRLLVRPRPAEEKSAGGVILSAGISGGATAPLEDALVGEVVAVGQDVSLEGVKVGDSVLFSKYSSSDVSLPDGGEVCFVAEKSVLAKLS